MVLAESVAREDGLKNGAQNPIFSTTPRIFDESVDTITLSIKLQLFARDKT